jgi:hypothetical protein
MRSVTRPHPTAMFANLLQLLRDHPHPAGATGFVEEIVVDDREPRDARTERLILVCWTLIAVKHVAIIWVCNRYPVPFHQLWINFPTWMLGALATGLYYVRTRPR